MPLSEDAEADRVGQKTRPLRKATAEELLAIAARFRASVSGPAPDHGEMLYDEHGLPK